MKVITFAALKGGVGKTTLSYNWGQWLAQNGSKVLLIDADYQLSLTTTFENMTTADFTTFDAFMGQNIELQKINDNLSLIPGSVQLHELEVILAPRTNKEFQLLRWGRKNLATLEQFDYIIIDTHPEFSTLVKNTLVFSDFIFMPLEPSRFGAIESRAQFLQYFSLFKEDSADPITGENRVDAKLRYIGNKIDSTTKSSQDFSEMIRNLDGVVATIKKREAYNQSTLVSTAVSYLPESYLKRSNGLEEEINTQFALMKAAVDAE